MSEKKTKLQEFFNFSSKHKNEKRRKVILLRYMNNSSYHYIWKFLYMKY